MGCEMTLPTYMPSPPHIGMRRKPSQSTHHASHPIRMYKALKRSAEDVLLINYSYQIETNLNYRCCFKIKTYSPRIGF